MILSLSTGLDFSAFADELTSGMCGDNLSYVFNAVTGTLTISGSGSMNNYADTSKLPFYNQKTIKHVVLNQGVGSIGNSAFFGCSNLEDVSMPVDGTNCVNYIGNNAFEGCTSLKEFTIPFYATWVGNSAFAGCTSLTEIKTISNCQFFNSENGVLYNREKTYLYAYPAGKSETICNIRENVKTIGSGAFNGCTNLEEIVLPSSITSIEQYAFNGCTNLQSINIPENVNTIGSYAFKDCKNISNISLPSDLSTINIGVFSGCSDLQSIVIPDNVTSIGRTAFYDCDSLETLTIPISATLYNAKNATSSDFSFGNCKNIKNITFTKGSGAPVDYSSSASNENLFKITPWYNTEYSDLSIMFDSGVESIGEYTFYKCSNLKYVTIPKTIHTIGKYAFNGSSIDKIYYDGTEEEWKLIDKTSYNSALSNSKVIYTVCKKHSYDDGKYDYKPTCIDEGQKTYTCKLCGQTKTEVIGALGHTPVIDEAIPATCTETGLTEGSHCSVCNAVIVPQDVVQATGHTVVVDESVPATCVSTGLTQGSHCEKCDKVFEKQEETPMIEHNVEIINYSAPTCYNNGYSGDEYCNQCEQILSYGEIIPQIKRIPATGKRLLLKNYIINNGLTDDEGNNYITNTQTIEGNVYVYKITYSDPYAKFVLSQITSDNTVTNLVIDENGSEYATVNYKWGKLINATSVFSSKDYNKDSSILFIQDKPDGAQLTLTNEQIQSLCNKNLAGAFYGWDILLMKYLYLDVTMGDLGFTSFEECGKHTWDSGKTTRQTTCTQNGIITYTCTVCGETKKETNQAYGHNWTSWSVTSSPIGCKDGESIRICNRCNSIEKLTIPASGTHNYDNGRVTKTTSTTYTKTFTCSGCGKTHTKTYNKKANTLTVKLKKPTIKFSKLKKKNQTIALNNWATVTKAQGKVTYKKSSGNKKITVSKAGKIIVKKGLKKGTYKVKIKVSAAGNATYKAGSKTVTVTIKVK